MTPEQMTPSSERLESLRSEVGPGPVILLNLLKWKEPDGQARFAEYGALSGPLIAREGAEVFYMGTVGPAVADHEEWDLCVMVRFPDIEAFIRLTTDPEYQKKAPALRAAALERTLWSVTQPAGG